MLYSNELLEVEGQKVLSIMCHKKHKHLPELPLKKEETYCFDCPSAKCCEVSSMKLPACEKPTWYGWCSLVQHWPSTLWAPWWAPSAHGFIPKAWVAGCYMHVSVLMLGNMPVLCLLIITYAIIFCLIGCVFIRWFPDRWFAVAQWLLWFAAYKLVWEAANMSLAAVGFRGRICFFYACLECRGWGGRTWRSAGLPFLEMFMCCSNEGSSCVLSLLVKAWHNSWALYVEMCTDFKIPF